MQEILFILNGPAYGTENAFNALRLARALQDKPEMQLKVFLMADATVCAKKDQKTPDGYYNLSRMILSLAQKKVPIGACGTCLDARGISDDELINGVRRSNMGELAEWVLASSKVITF